MSLSLLEQLIESLRVLPGVGQKTAQRMAYHLLEREREGGKHLAETLSVALERIGHSPSAAISPRARSARSAPAAVAIGICCARWNRPPIGSPSSRVRYRGVYFILQGRLSPLDGIGPRELGLDQLGERLKQGEISELIIATNPTVEGEATAHYLAQLARQHNVKPSRLAHGVPLGGELEYVDRGTLSHAFGSRSEMP